MNGDHSLPLENEDRPVTLAGSAYRATICLPRPKERHGSKFSLGGSFLAAKGEDLRVPIKGEPEQACELTEY